MSYAIFELDIREPPATVYTHNGGWYVVCERCEKRSPVTQLLSVALLVHANHTDVHTSDDEIALKEWFSSTRHALAVHNRVHSEWREFPVTATVEATRKDVA